MEIQRFRGATEAQALEAARLQLGEDAVILDTVEDNAGVEIFATLETGDAMTSATLTPADDHEAAHDGAQSGGSLRGLAEELAQIRDFRIRLDELVTRADAIPEEMQSELFLLRRSLKKELIELKQFREARAAEANAPDPDVVRLQSDLAALGTSLSEEIDAIAAYRRTREDADAKREPALDALGEQLGALQASLAEELGQLAAYRERRQRIDEEMDPQTSRRWAELNNVQDALSTELTQLCEYRMQRARLDAERDPITEQIQQELADLQGALDEEVESLRRWRSERIASDADEEASTRTLHQALQRVQDSLAGELEKLGEYHAYRLKCDAEQQPALIALNDKLAELQSALEAEVETARSLSGTHTELANRADDVTQHLALRVEAIDEEVSKLGQRLAAEMEALATWREERRLVAEAMEPQQRSVLDSLNEIRDEVKGELAALKEHRASRETVAARLDPITTGLQHELTNLQADLRSELVTLRQYREQHESDRQRLADSLSVFETIRQEAAADQAALTEAIVLLREDNLTRDDHKDRLLQEIAALRDAREEINEERAVLGRELAAVRSEREALAGTHESFKRQVSEEIATLRSLATAQAPAERAIDARADSNPRRVESLGLSRDIARRLNSALPAQAGWKTVLETIGQMLTSGEDDIIRHGGTVAVLGSTGVGKTTTVAKLAARYAERHGAGKVALISTDTLRIGGADQLGRFAADMDMPLAHASDAAELGELLESAGEYELVLIDTAGINQRDVHLADHLNTLTAAGKPIQHYLALSATAEAGLTREVIDAFGRIPLAGAIITKVDEASTMGPALSGVIRADLPITYLCNGQHVPSDMLIGSRTEVLKLCRSMILHSSGQSGTEAMSA